MQFGSEWYLNVEDEVESVEEEESSSEEEGYFGAAAPVRAMKKMRAKGAASSSQAPVVKHKKKKWRLQPTGDDDGKVHPVTTARYPPGFVSNVIRQSRILLVLTKLAGLIG